MILAALLTLSGACASPSVSGRILQRKTLGESSAGGLGGTKVYGYQLQTRPWNERDPIPAGMGRVVLLRPKVPGDLVDGFIFTVNDKGEFFLGPGCALTWNQPAGTCKIRLVSYFIAYRNEYRFSDEMEPLWLKVPEGKTLYVFCGTDRRTTPSLGVITAEEAQGVLERTKLERFALPRSAEEAIPRFP